MLPVAKLVRPSSLDGQQNGLLPAGILRTVKTTGCSATFVTPAHRSWVALCAAAEAGGHVLVPFSTYRSHAKQKALFLSRYSTVYKAGVDTKWFEGKTWYLHSGYVTAAPGTSNHGWGLAVDLHVLRGGKSVSIDTAALNWLISNAARFGWSWEIQSEKWHIRYVTGDSIPTATIDHEGEAPAEEDDMPLTTADLDAIGARVQAELKKGTGTGKPDWPSTNKAILATVQGHTNQLKALVANDTRLAEIVTQAVRDGYATGSADPELVAEAIIRRWADLLDGV